MQDLCGFAVGSCLGPGGTLAFCLLTIPYGVGKAYKNVPLVLLRCLDLWNVDCSRHASFLWKSPPSDVMPPFLRLCSCCTVVFAKAGITASIAHVFS